MQDQIPHLTGHDDITLDEAFHKLAAEVQSC